MLFAGPHGRLLLPQALEPLSWQSYRSFFGFGCNVQDLALQDRTEEWL